jgi:arsenate reductase (glutaredoxin)
MKIKADKTPVPINNATCETLLLYGIPNCDTTKKAMAWLTKNNIPFIFHDYKIKGISKNRLEEWFTKAKWELIFNKRSTTWRELPLIIQNKTNNPSAAIDLMMQNNSIIKRPIIEFNGKLIIGFNEAQYKLLPPALKGAKE